MTDSADSLRSRYTLAPGEPIGAGKLEHRDRAQASRASGRGITEKSWQDLAVEIVEAVLLGVVAVATAWSAYHAAKWDGHEAELYAQASTLRIEADELVTLGGQRVSSMSRRSTHG